MRLAKAILIIALTGCARMTYLDGSFQILVPESTENIITNPSLVGVEGWQSMGSTITQTNERARFGISSGKVVTDGLVENEGAYFRVKPNTQQLPYAASVYVRGEGEIRVRLVDAFNGNTAVSEDIALTDDFWIRVSDVIGQTGPIDSDDLRLYVETIAPQAVTFYVDGAQIEQKTYSTTYCDGEQAGCKWNVVVDGSESNRLASERSGGRFLDIEDEVLGVYMTQVGGTGMPPVTQNTRDLSLLPGVEYQSTKTQPRTLTFLLHTKDERASLLPRTDRTFKRLLELRQLFLDVVRPDRVEPQQPFTLRYVGGRVPVDIQCLYEGGMEFDGDIRNPYLNSFPIRLLCPDPFWVEDNQDIFELAQNASFVAPRGFRFIDGEYVSWGVFNGEIEKIIRAPSGIIYIGGVFGSIDGDGSLASVASWDGGAFSSLGGGLNGIVHDLVASPDGSIYASGTFTDVKGGVGGTFNRVARWDPVTLTWNALGAGLNGTVFALAAGENGDLFAGGEFTDLQGGAGNTLNRLARWDAENLVWESMGSGPGLINGSVATLALSIDGNTIFIGGGFDAEFGGTPGDVDRIASYDISTDTITELGSGADDQVNSLVITSSGLLYIGGDFTSIGGVSVNYAALWNGTSFQALGDGVSLSDGVAFVNRVFLIGDLVYFSGDFDEAGGISLTSQVAAWNGSSWLDVPFNLPTNNSDENQLWTVAENEQDLYLGGPYAFIGGGRTTVKAPATTVVANRGTASARPEFIITGPGRLVLLENKTSDRRLFFSYSINSGEDVVIDIGTASVTTSFLGNALSILLPTSDIAQFDILSGNNQLLAFLDDGDTDSIVLMSFLPRHWGLEGVQ